MSISALTSEAARLLAYFQGAESSINSQVAAAIAAVPALTKTYYVDAINGDDDSAGTVGAPFATLNKALTAINGVSGVNATIRLFGASSYDFDRVCSLANASISVRNHDSGMTPKVVFKARTINEGGTDYASSFCFQGSNNSISFAGVHVEMEAKPAAIPTYTFSGITQGAYHSSVSIENGELTISDLPVFSGVRGLYSARVNSVTLHGTPTDIIAHVGNLAALYLGGLVLDGFAESDLPAMVSGRLYAAAGHPLNIISNFDFEAA